MKIRILRGIFLRKEKRKVENKKVQFGSQYSEYMPEVKIGVAVNKGILIFFIREYCISKIEM